MGRAGVLPQGGRSRYHCPLPAAYGSGNTQVLHDAFGRLLLAPSLAHRVRPLALALQLQRRDAGLHSPGAGVLTADPGIVLHRCRKQRAVRAHSVLLLQWRQVRLRKTGVRAGKTPRSELYALPSIHKACIHVLTPFAPGRGAPRWARGHTHPRRPRLQLGELGVLHGRVSALHSTLIARKGRP